MKVDAREAMGGSPASRPPRHVLVLATEEISGAELTGGLCRDLREVAAEPIVVVPAVEKTPFRHALGDVDAAAEEARRHLERSLAELRRGGLPARGEIGESDPLVAAEDALRQYPTDEVWIVAHCEEQARWFEDGLFERAQEALQAPVRLVTVRRDDGEPGATHLEGVRRSEAGLKPPAGHEHELHPSANLPPFARGDLLGVLVAIVGTIAAIVLAAIGPGPDTAGGAAQILIAMAVTLINMAHVVGLLLLESVHYRGGWQRFFRNLSATATPLAVAANLLIALLD
jgi:hypothetical protein